MKAKLITREHPASLSGEIHLWIPEDWDESEIQRVVYISNNCMKSPTITFYVGMLYRKELAYFLAGERKVTERTPTLRLVKTI